MLQFKGTTNVSEKQIQSGCSGLLFKVTKNTPVDNPVEFFALKDADGCIDDLNGFDKINVRYVSNLPGVGQKSIISNLPIFPLIIACTTGENHIIFKENAAGKIVSAEFTLQIGVNGALKLNGDSYISVQTMFNDLASMEIYSMDGVPTTLAYMYKNVKLDSNVQRNIPLSGVNKLIFDPMVESLELSNSEGTTVQLAYPEIVDVSEALNDLLALRGKDIIYKRVDGGTKYFVSAGVEATKTYTGGLFYPVLGVDGYDTARVQASRECYVYNTVIVDLGPQIIQIGE